MICSRWPVLDRYNRTSSRRPIRGLTEEAFTHLTQYAWPHNVRELEQVIDLAARSAQGELITVSDLKQAAAWVTERQQEGGMPWQRATELAESMKRQWHRQQLIWAYILSGGVVERAAEMLGIARAHVYAQIPDLFGQQPLVEAVAAELSPLLQECEGIDQLVQVVDNHFRRSVPFTAHWPPLQADALRAVLRKCRLPVSRG
jgi:transcriptional regulator with AAA-type ATPase domain